MYLVSMRSVFGVGAPGMPDAASRRTVDEARERGIDYDY
jgi:hypothetical protein